LKDRKIIYFVFLTCSFLVILSYIYWDMAIANYFKYGMGLKLRAPAQFITVLGDAKWYYLLLLFLAAVFYFFKKNKLYFMRVIYILISLITSGIINSSIKWLAGRHRPKNLFQHDLYGFTFFASGYELNSFPSGHTAVVFCLATAVVILFPRWRIPAYTTALLIGISRVVITSHFLADVIGGAGVGIISAVIVKIIFEKKEITLSNDKK